MAELETRHFGTISCGDEAILLFPAGLPAFEAARRFVLLDRPASSPVVFLQSLEDGNLCFLLLPVQLIDPDYHLGVSVEDLRTLGLDETRQPEIGTEVACFAVLSVSENGPPSANLLAPVVVNLKTRAAAQAIRLDSVYSHRHLLETAGARCS